MTPLGFSDVKRLRDLISAFEGCSLEAYQDLGGTWTIGYGHTVGVEKGMFWTQEQAEAVLLSDIEPRLSEVQQLMTYPGTKAHHVIACTSFAFNEGVEAFAHSNILKYHNHGWFEAAKDDFSHWVYSHGKVIQGLVNRRTIEAQIYGEA